MFESEHIPAPALLGLVADTHRSSARPVALPAELLVGLAGCDLILHLGDANAIWVLERLAEIAPVLGVHGNNDEPDVRRILPRERVLRVGRWTIGMIHGHGGGTARQVARTELGGRVDCVVYGHSHIPENARHGDVLMVNPGSPTQRRWGPSRAFAIMHVGEVIDVKHVELS